MSLRNTRAARPDGPHGEAARLTLLSQAGELLSGSLDRRRLAALAAQLIVPRLADWVAFFPASDHPNVSVPEHLWHREENRLDALAAGLGGWQPPAGTGDASWPVPVSSPLGQVLPLPLRARGCSLGTLVLGGPGRRSGGSVTVGPVLALADRIAPPVHNAPLLPDQPAVP